MIPWAQAPIYYEPLKVMDNVNNSESWTRAFWCIEHLRVVDGMDDFGS